jgi:hypothetical protein
VWRGLYWNVFVEFPCVVLPCLFGAQVPEGVGYGLRCGARVGVASLCSAV